MSKNAPIFWSTCGACRRRASESPPPSSPPPPCVRRSVPPPFFERLLRWLFRRGYFPTSQIPESPLRQLLSSWSTLRAWLGWMPFVFVTRVWGPACWSGTIPLPACPPRKKQRRREWANLIEFPESFGVFRRAPPISPNPVAVSPKVTKG